MKRWRTRTLMLGLAAILWLQPREARAWNPTGHMLIASIAFEQLPPASRAQWAAVLRQYPSFAAWELSAPKDSPNFDLDRYLFLRASTWPDDIRRSGSPYDHPVWHYIDYPLEAPGFPLEPAPADTADILVGLSDSEKTLLNPAAPAADRAAALSWIMHLVGDIQQPLHCATLVNATYPKPAGDRGGNLFFISLAGNTLNLHALWDGLPGSAADLPEISLRAQQLAEHFPRNMLPELTQARDARAWSLEGRALAIDAVYRRGNLAGGSNPHAASPPLPEGYLTAARALAERRLAVGGYRLADTLQQLATAGH